jgi:hypothetical protein
MKFAAMHYVKTALFPWGTILSVASAVGEHAAKLQLQPVEFEPGQATIKPEMTEYLGKLRQMLVEKPDLNLTLCGIATLEDGRALKSQLDAAADGKETAATTEPEVEPAEQAAVAAAEGDGEAQAVPQQEDLPREAMLDLANARSHAVQDYFVASDIEVGRALLCRSAIDESNDARPGVNISF